MNVKLPPKQSRRKNDNLLTQLTTLFNNRRHQRKVSMGGISVTDQQHNCVSSKANYFSAILPAYSPARYLIIVLGLILMSPAFSIANTTGKLALPPAGSLYHGAFPGSDTGYEDDTTPVRMQQYADAVGKPLSWVYFSSEWNRSRAFPTATCEWIREAGAVPYVRLMLRSHYESNMAEEKFTGERILAGEFDDDLIAWAQGAKKYGAPIIAEYGVECNGYWFAWNGRWLRDLDSKQNDKAALRKGVERFVAIYRHIITLSRQAGATNISWVFHISAVDDPGETWNKFENYYPGDDYIDWIGVTVYGAQFPKDAGVYKFDKQFSPAYKRIQVMAPDKPVILSEMGCAAGSKTTPQAKWSREAVEDMLAGKWPKLIGFCWWNSRFGYDDNPENDTNLRVDDSPELQKAFFELFKDPRIIGRPIITPDIIGGK